MINSNEYFIAMILAAVTGSVLTHCILIHSLLNKAITNNQKCEHSQSINALLISVIIGSIIGFMFAVLFYFDFGTQAQLMSIDKMILCSFIFGFSGENAIPKLKKMLS